MTSLRELARLAGVDVSTVSRALADSPRVKSDTKERIKKLAAEQHYIPDDIARGLVGKRTHTVGVIIPEFKNTFYAEIIEGVESVLSPGGYALLFGKSDFRHENEIKYLDLFLRKRVDGIIACSISKEAVNDFRRNKRTVPMILADTLSRENEYDSVAIDNEKGILKIIEHLTKLGHREIGFVGDVLVTGERLKAYQKALRHFGLPYRAEYVAVGKERHERGGYLRMKELLGTAAFLTAVVAETDNLAIGAMHAIREAGLHVPEDISLVGFDDILVSSYMEVPLTTVVQPKLEIGRTAAELLLDRLEKTGGDPIRQVVLEPELVVRKTTRAKDSKP